MVDVTFGSLKVDRSQLNMIDDGVDRGSHLAWVSAMIISHLYSPLGSRSVFDSSFAVSSMLLYSNSGGHDGTVAIHSLHDKYSRYQVSACAGTS